MMKSVSAETSAQFSSNANRDLLIAWTVRTLRARYQQSFLGVLWTILQPAATVLIFSVIFTQIIPIKTGNTSYILFSAVAMIPWTYLTGALNDMVMSLVGNLNLVTKIYFPREILPFATLLARLFDLLISAVMLAVLLAIFRTPIFPIGWLYLPVILLIQTALILGIGLITAALNVFYRDVRYIVGLGVQLWFYLSPILYPVDRVPARFQNLYFLNPMAGITTAYRDVLLDQRLPGTYLLTAGLISLAVLAVGYWFFKRVEFQFADVV
jgi:lipopolysaccharide transport system permease protein